jgi:alkylation response protein AidB-like acyl-CoA dehydrogenase
MHEFAELDFTADDIAVRDLARRFTEEHVAPHAHRIDEEESFPMDAIRAAADIGLLGILIPEDEGGSGGSMLQYCLTMEELSTACGATAATFMTQAHGMIPIHLAGNAEQKARWLPRACTGEVITAIALTEPHAGSDMPAMTTSAKKVDGGYLINGEKIFITNGNYADVISLFARTSPERYDGISLFAVDAKSEGITFGKPIKKMGIRGSDTAQIFFTDVFVPESDLLGEEGIGFRTAMGALGDARISTAAKAIGLARGSWDRAFAYSQEREQFGRPIYEFQAIQMRLMRLFSMLTSARLMTYQLARAIDQGVRSEYAVESAMAKAYCSDVAMEVTSDCVEVLGGYGYTREYEVERFMRDAKIAQIYDGTNDINRTVMAKQILRRHGGRS